MFQAAALALTVAMMVFQPRSRIVSVTIEVLQEVEGVADYGLTSQRGKLYLGRKMEPFRLAKGERFQMVKVYSEGECRIRVRGVEYDLGSCPWLPGFADNQEDFFKVVQPQRRR